MHILIDRRDDRGTDKRRASHRSICRVDVQKRSQAKAGQLQPAVRLDDFRLDKDAAEMIGSPRSFCSTKRPRDRVAISFSLREAS
jgi:hypothetical protein